MKNVYEENEIIEMTSKMAKKKKWRKHEMRNHEMKKIGENKEMFIMKERSNEENNQRK